MTFQSSSLLLIRLIPDCVQYERLDSLLVDNKFLANFQHSTTFNIQQLSIFNNNYGPYLTQCSTTALPVLLTNYYRYAMQLNG